MYNTKFLLENGKELYPGYLDKEQREIIKFQYQGKREYMRCGCRPTEKLFYRISEDLRIYPEHNNYVHDVYCCRYRDAAGDTSRQSAYIINEENGNVTAYTSFDPKSFNITEEIQKEQDNIVPETDDSVENIFIEKDEATPQMAERKEPSLSLEELVRSINVDSFTEKILNNKQIENREKFSVFVYMRMKRVSLARSKKSIGDLSLEKDGVRFMYAPLAGIMNKTENETTRCYLKTKGTDGKIFNNYVYPKILKNALKKFKKSYGIYPNENTVMAGFQYIRKNKNGTSYRVMGRVHLFQVSNIGLYCRNMAELKAFNKMHEIAITSNDIKFWIPPEDADIGSIVEVKGKRKKILMLFHSKKSKSLSYDSSIYVPYVVDASTEISKQKFYDLLDE